MKKIFLTLLIGISFLLSTNKSEAFWCARGDAHLTPDMWGTYSLTCWYSQRICASYLGTNSYPQSGDVIKVWLQSGTVEVRIMSASYSQSEETEEGLNLYGFEATVTLE